MADGGVIKVVSLRRRSQEDSSNLYVFCIELSSVYISALLPAMLSAQTPASLILLLCIGIHLSFCGILVVLVISFGCIY